MFCPGCGKPVTEGVACECGYVQPAPQAAPQITANDLVNIATSKFSINALISFGAAFLVLIMYFLPFTRVSLGGIFGVSPMTTSGWSLMSFANFWLMLVPIAGVVVLAFLFTGERQKLLCLGAAGAGVLGAMSFAFAEFSGVGAWLSLVFWGVIFAAWLLEVIGFDVVKGKVK